MKKLIFSFNEEFFMKKKSRFFLKIRERNFAIFGFFMNKFFWNFLYLFVIAWSPFLEVAWVED